MENTKPATAKIWITYGLGGFLLGTCLVSISAVGLVTHETANHPPTQMLVPSLTVATQALLDEALQAFNENPQQVLDILGPHLEEFTDPNELAKALEYMGNAELMLGHHQLAAAYFERLIQISPTPENYITLARIYESGGDLEKAVEYYGIYLNSDDPAIPDDFRVILQDHVDEIQSILTGSAPTLAP